jgi:hypothetical protein
MLGCGGMALRWAKKWIRNFLIGYALVLLEGCVVGLADVNVVVKVHDAGDGSKASDVVQ